MSCSEKPIKHQQPCPRCGASSYGVSRETMLHHLRYPCNMSIKDESYFFCASPSCNMGYFSDTRHFLLHALREEKKIRKNHLCYCFDISEETYQNAVKAGTASKLKGAVISLTRESLCACTVRNPSGRCCLNRLTLKGNQLKAGKV